MPMHFEKVFKWAKLVDNTKENHQQIQTLSYDDLSYRANKFDSESEALSAIENTKYTDLVLLTVYQKYWREE